MLILEYQKEWATNFKAIEKVLSDNSSTEDFGVEHVGSTAVEGLAAKPIIDIDIVYQNPASFAIIKADLERIGYYHNGDQGIPGRDVFKRRETPEPHPVLDDIKHHLYVCPVDGKELQRHLLFRDQLRQNEAARREYAALKFRIAELAGQDRKRYAELKEVMARELVNRLLPL